MQYTFFPEYAHTYLLFPAYVLRKKKNLCIQNFRYPSFIFRKEVRDCWYYNDSPKCGCISNKVPNGEKTVLSLLIVAHQFSLCSLLYPHCIHHLLPGEFSFSLPGYIKLYKCLFVCFITSIHTIEGNESVVLMNNLVNQLAVLQLRLLNSKKSKAIASSSFYVLRICMYYALESS